MEKMGKAEKAQPKKMGGKVIQSAMRDQFKGGDKFSKKK